MKVKKDVNRRQAADGYLLMGNRGWPGWKNDWGWWIPNVLTLAHYFSARRHLSIPGFGLALERCWGLSWDLGSCLHRNSQNLWLCGLTVCKRDFADVIKLGSLDGELISDYLGRPKEIARGFMRGRQEDSSQKEMWWQKQKLEWFSLKMKRPRAKECR